MQPEVRGYLNDVLNSAGMLVEFTAGKDFSDYSNDPMLRAATERLFGIIGEAISRMSRIDEATTSQISEYRRIISFRNILIHQYDSVDNLVVWGVLQTKLPALALEVQELIGEEPTSPYQRPNL